MSEISLPCQAPTSAEEFPPSFWLGHVAEYSYLHAGTPASRRAFAAVADGQPIAALAGLRGPCPRSSLVWPTRIG
jgi:hypothetical protein